ncbi:MAG: LVIVD repeat-containing protein [Lentimicrobium sp.]
MKTTNQTLLSLILLITSTLLFSGCKDNTYEEITYKANVPVYMGLDEFRGAVKMTSPQSLENPGKIYFKENFLFVNEYHKGVHVIDNSNPSAPNSVAFIEIPGNVDIAIRHNILFADSFIDLVAIDITNPANPVEVDRVEDAFPNVLPPPDYSYPVYGLDFNKGVVVGWETKDVTEVVEKGNGIQNQYILYDGLGVPAIGATEVSIGPSAIGIGGSMARFTISTNYMYAVHNNDLKVFDIGETPGISSGNVIPLDRQVETIFPYDNKLFLGTTTGMMVYDLSSPATPAFLSVFTHINSCDPVVVEGNLAYVTLRSGTQCNGFTNQLDVVDISSVTNPFLVKSYPMFNPHGLGIDNHTLFICDGDAGLKVYDATDPMEIHMHQLAHFADIKTYDVIPYNGLLMMIGAGGLYQYDYSDLDSLRLLSHIPVVIP